MLSELAIADPAAFDAIVEQARRRIIISRRRSRLLERATLLVTPASNSACWPSRMKLFSE